MIEIPNRRRVRKAIKTARYIAERCRKSGWPTSTFTSEQRGKVERAIVLLQDAAPDHYPISNDDRTVTLPAWHRGLIDTLGFVAVTFKRWIGHRIDDRPLSSPEDVLRTLNLAEGHYDSMPDVPDLKRSAGGGVVMVRADTASRQSGLSDQVESAPPALTNNQSLVLQTMALFDASLLVTAEAIAAEKVAHALGGNSNAATKALPARTEVVLWEGAEHNERNVRLARTRSAYLEAHGNVSEALAALKAGGNEIARSTFYNHLNALDEAIPRWRESVQLSNPTGNLDGMPNVGTRRKSRDKVR